MTFNEGDIARRVGERVQLELPLLADHLRRWVEAHLTVPREITVWSDPEGAAESRRVWLVTDDTGEADGSCNLTYDPASDSFGTAMRMQSGVLWDQGADGSLVDAVESM